MFQTFFPIKINPSSQRIRWRHLFISFGLAIGTVLSASLQVARVSAASCDDVKFIFARGSGEKLVDKSSQAWISNITTLIRDTGLSYSFYELGSRSYGGYQYPAVSVSEGLSGIANLLGAAVSAGEAFEFGRSVEQGKGELKAYIDFVSTSCPNTKFVLGGYSQGAMVVSGTLGQLDNNKVIYAATFGDPKLYLPEGKAKSGGRNRPLPDACRGVNLSNYRIYVPDCHTYEGVLGSYRPYQSTSYIGKLGTWCNKSDIMCSSGMSVSDHVSYVSEDLYGDAAELIRQKLSAAFPDAIMNTKRNNHNLIFLFDTTGSMSSNIDQYRDEAKKLAAEVYASGGRVALFEFRDLKEDFPTRELCDFSCSEAEFAQALDVLETSGGGDANESLLSAVLTTMNAVTWQNGATKSIVALTDAGYHSPDHDGTTYVAVTERSLEIDPVNLYVITTSSNMSKYGQLTSATGGKVFNLHDNISLSSGQIFSRPVAKLSMPEYRSQPGESITFDASASYSLNDEALTFDWDLDGDDIFEHCNTGPVISHNYRSTFNDFIQVRVKDTHGSSTMSAKVIVNNNSANQLSKITHLSATMTDDEAVQINFSTDADQVLLSINDAVFGTTAVTNGAGNIAVENVDDAAIITLTPYRDGARGIARSAIVTKDGEITITENPAEDTDYYGSASSTSPSAPEPIITDIPKAPDTGAYDKRLALAR